MTTSQSTEQHRPSSKSQSELRLTVPSNIELSKHCSIWRTSRLGTIRVVANRLQIALFPSFNVYIHIILPAGYPMCPTGCAIFPIQHRLTGPAGMGPLRPFPSHDRPLVRARRQVLEVKNLKTAQQAQPTSANLEFKLGLMHDVRRTTILGLPLAHCPYPIPSHIRSTASSSHMHRVGSSLLEKACLVAIAIPSFFLFISFNF